MTRRLVVLTAALAVLALGVMSSRAIRLEGSAGAADRAEAGQRATAVQTDPTIAALRDTRTSADVVPQAIADGPLLADRVAYAESARRVGATTSSGWILRGEDDSICHLREGFLTCAPASFVDDRGLAPSVVSRAGSFRVEAVAADGVNEASVVLWDHRVVDVPVVNNAFLLESPSPVRSVRWEGPNGPESMDFEWFFDLQAREQARLAELQSASAAPKEP